MDERSNGDAGSTPSRPKVVPGVRPATADDAAHLAAFVDFASHGLARVFWAAMAEPGEDLLAVGTRRARRDDGAFTWRNATIAELDGSVAGGLIAYSLGTTPEPVDELPPIVRPLVALENAAPGTRYVNVLATYPAFRRRGVARTLLAHAVAVAGAAPVSLIVADGNHGARQAYARFGFVETERRPLVRDGWDTSDTEWILMLRAPG